MGINKKCRQRPTYFFSGTAFIKLLYSFFNKCNKKMKNLVAAFHFFFFLYSILSTGQCRNVAMDWKSSCIQELFVSQTWNKNSEIPTVHPTRYSDGETMLLTQLLLQRLLVLSLRGRLLWEAFVAFVCALATTENFPSLDWMYFLLRLLLSFKKLRNSSFFSSSDLQPHRDSGTR